MGIVPEANRRGERGAGAAQRKSIEVSGYKQTWTRAEKSEMDTTSLINSELPT